MDDKSKKTLGIALGGLAIVGLGIGLLRGKKAPPIVPTCPTGTHWDGTECAPDAHSCPTGSHWNGTVCLPDDEDPHTCDSGFHWDDAAQACVSDAHTCPINQHWDEDQNMCVPDVTNGTPEGLWAKANLITTRPLLEITDFHLTNVYAEAKLSSFVVDEWWDRLNSENAVIVETPGDPYHMPISYIRTDAEGNWHSVGSYEDPPVGIRVGQLRGHTWGSRLNVYEWDGSHWNEVFVGSLGPNQGWQTPPQYDLAEGVIVIKSNVDWDMPLNMITYNIEVKPVGNWRYYCFDQSQYITESLAAGQTVSIPIILRAYGGSYSSYANGTPMQKGDYTVGLCLRFSCVQMSYKASWYSPLSTQQNYLTWADMTQGASIINSYSLFEAELMSECLKVWREDPVFGGYRVIWALPPNDKVLRDIYEWPSGGINGPRKNFLISVT